MRLELTGRQIDITPAIRRIVDTKLAKLERVLSDSAVSAQVVVTREKKAHRTDVTLHARGENFLHGIGRGESVAVAMSSVVDKLAQQARKVKGKYETRKRRGIRGGAAAPEPAAAETPARPVRRPRPRMPRILKAERQIIRTMTVTDAAAAIDGGSGLVVFMDAETAQIAVLYRAPGGDLTLVQTKA